MTDYIEIDFIGVETKKSGDAIPIRYLVNQKKGIHIVDGGYLETGDQIIEHIHTHYGDAKIDHVILTHPDQDHANGLRKVLEECEVGALWINRPWLYAEQIIDRFPTYNSIKALQKRLRDAYEPTAILEDIANERRIPIFSPLQGCEIGPFIVLAPSKSRYLDLIVESDKTPTTAEQTDQSRSSLLFNKIKEAASYIKSAWGIESFPDTGTSSENEMSVVQFARINGKRILLTADAGKEALAEAANYLENIGEQLPGLDLFQVPHHGGRHNLSTEILDRWLGPCLPNYCQTPTWSAVCSSAKLDEAHPKKVVIRAIMHRGGHFAATEGLNICWSNGITREGWGPIPQAPYPEEQED